MGKLVVSLIFIFFLAGFILFARVCEIDTIETMYADEELTFQLNHLSTTQVDKLVFWKATQGQYLLKNTDTIDGTFTLNFLFSNEEETKTNTRKISIAAGAQEAVTETSPFNGISTIQLNVIPSTKEIPYEYPAKIKVSIWKYFMDSMEMYETD